jgi:hypothetical protein
VYRGSARCCGSEAVTQLARGGWDRVDVVPLLSAITRDVCVDTAVGLLRCRALLSVMCKVRSASRVLDSFRAGRTCIRGLIGPLVEVMQ